MKNQLIDIEFGNSADIPGVRVAKWTDSRGRERVTMYKGKLSGVADFRLWVISIVDVNVDYDGFSTSTASSVVSIDQAAADWIATWF